MSIVGRVIAYHRPWRIWSPLKQPGWRTSAGVGIPGLHHSMKSSDNSVDEAMNRHTSEIKVTLHRDGTTVTVADNTRRGIPVDKHPEE